MRRDAESLKWIPEISRSAPREFKTNGNDESRREHGTVQARDQRSGALITVFTGEGS